MNGNHFKGNLMDILRPNLDRKGRTMRALGAFALGAGAIVTWPYSYAAGIALSASSAFVAFEAARGWCVFRACSLKTRR
jgi:hypothetical protein